MDRKFIVNFKLSTAEIKQEIAKMPRGDIQAILDKLEDKDAECPFEFSSENDFSAIGCDIINTVTVTMRLR